MAQLSVGVAQFFADERPEFGAGAAVRIYLTRRVSVEAEFLGARDHQFEHQLLGASLAIDVKVGGRNPGRERRYYVIVGGGYLREHDTEFEYTLAKWSGHAGFGAKLFVSGRLFVAPEVRIGWEGPLWRATLGVGYGHPRNRP